MEGAVEVAKRMGIPLVATSDAHYVNREDADAQDVLLCINTGKFRTDTNRMRMESESVLSPQPGGNVRGVSRAGRRASREARRSPTASTSSWNSASGTFPTFSAAGKQNARRLSARAVPRRACRSATPTSQSAALDGELARRRACERLERELDVINKLGFPNYFLIVWDFVRYAREQDIPATARGIGRRLARGLRAVPEPRLPAEYDLLFERFLDLNRREAPDIDIDFCKDRRGEVIQYVKDKYGEENVAQIGTFGTLAARAAIRDVGRALGMPIPRVDPIVAMVPEELDITLDEALEQSDDLKKTYDTDGEIRELFDLAMKIEGLARNVGTHAAAVVIADRAARPNTCRCAACKDKDGSHHPMGDGRRRGGRPVEDGLPRPAQPDDPLQGGRSDRADDRRAGRSVSSSRSTTQKRSPCSAAAKPRASSSSKAAAFATCCSG